MPSLPKPPAAKHHLSPKPPDLGAVLSCARSLGHAPASGAQRPPLKGRNLGVLCGNGQGAHVEAFQQAATELGARAAVLAASQTLGSTPQTAEEAARLLSRLYDAVTCDGVPDQVVDALARTATIPVTNGYIAAAAQAATLAARLDGADAPQHRHRRILQALVLQSMC